MLASARDKARAAGSNLRFAQQDMRTLDVGSDPFEAVSSSAMQKDLDVQDTSVKSPL